MGPAFDSYHKWLGIPPEDQPPHHYRLLGIKEFEADPDVIQAAADQRMAHLRTYQTGRHADWSQRLLNEVAAAKICLLTPAKRAVYDEQLRATRPPEPPPAEPLPFDIVVDVPPRTAMSRSARTRKRNSPALIGAGMGLLGVVVIVTLAYRATDSGDVSGLFKGPLEQRLEKSPSDGDKSQAAPSPTDATPVEAVRPKEPAAPISDKASKADEKKNALPETPKPADAATTTPSIQPMPDIATSVTKSDEPSPPDLGSPSNNASQPPAQPAEPAKPLKPTDEASKPKAKPVVPAPKPKNPARIGRWFSLLPSPSELTGWETAAARCVYLNRIIELRGGELYCPIVAKDATIRAKVNRRTDQSIRLLVRNCDQGCYFVQLSSSSWAIIKATRNPPNANQQPAWRFRWAREETLSTIAVKRNIPNLVFEMGLGVVGNTLTVYFNRQAILQTRDAAFSEGVVGIAASDGNGVLVSDVEMLIPKGSLVADQRVMKP